MPIQSDDRAINLVGNNFVGLRFLDDDRVERASIYLDDNNNLNIGTFQVAGTSDSGGDSGGSLDLSDVGFLVMAGSGSLNQERVLSARDGLIATDGGGNGSFYLDLGTPGTLSVSTSNGVTASSHTHGITTSSNPGAAARILASTSAGALTLNQLNVDNLRLDGNALSAQTGDLTLTAAGSDVVMGSNINIGANNFVSQLTGWRVTYGGDADFRNIYADELHVKAFIADVEQALAGGQIISKSVALLSRDFTIPVGGRAITDLSTVDNWVSIAGDFTSIIGDGTSFAIAGSTGNDGTYTVDHTELSAATHTKIYVTGSIVNATVDGEVRFRASLFVEDLPGFENTAVFTTDDWVRLRVIDRSGGGLVVADVWGTVELYNDLSGGEQWWRFYTRDDGDVAGDVVNAGALALDYGASGDGWHEITTLDPDSPYARIVTWVTDPSNSANYTLRSQIGNLDGITDADFPSIGGWGLYSTSAYLKGEIQAAGGDIVLGDSGIHVEVDANLTYDSTKSLTFGVASNTSLARLYAVGNETSSDYGRLYLQVENPTDTELAELYLEARGDTSNNTRIVVNTDQAFLNADDITLGSGSGIITADLNEVDVKVDFEVNSGAALFVDKSANSVGIGTGGAPSFRLDVRDDVASTYVARFFNDGNASTRWGIRITAGEDSNPTVPFIAFANGADGTVGSVTGDGAGGVDYNVTSDERLKQDITPLASSLDKVLALRPVAYRGKGAPLGRDRTAGLIAQEVMAVMPEAATYDEDEDMYGLAWNKVIPFLVGAVQELETRLSALEAV